MLAIRTDSHTSFRYGLRDRGASLARLMIAVPGPTVTAVGEDDVIALAVAASQLGCALKAAIRAIHFYAAKHGTMLLHDTYEWGVPPGYEVGATVCDHGQALAPLHKAPEPRTEIEAEFVDE